MDKLLYLKEKNYKTKIVYEDKEKVVDIITNKFIDNLCISFLSTKQGRITAFKKLFKYKYNVPIFINKNILLMKIKAKDIIWVNFLLILKIYKEIDCIIIIFKCGKKLKIEAKYKTVIKKYNELYNVYLYIQKKII